MFTKQFLLDLLERALKTFAQSLGACITTVVAGETLGLGDVNWGAALSIAGLATLYSVLTSIASTGVNRKNSASLVD